MLNETIYSPTCFNQTWINVYHSGQNQVKSVTNIFILLSKLILFFLLKSNT